MSLGMKQMGAGRLSATRPGRLTSRTHAVSRPASDLTIFTGAATLVATALQAAPAGAVEAAAVAPAAAPVAAPVAAPDISADVVDSTIASLISAIKAAGTVLKSGADAVGSGVETLKEGYSSAEPYLQQGYNTVEPYFERSYTTVEPYVKQAFDSVGPAITAATPVVKDTVNGAVSSSGLDLSTITTPLSKVLQVTFSTLTPLVKTFIAFVVTTPPVLLGEYALGGFVLYLTAPALLGAIYGTFRGYAGEVTATAAVDLLINGNALLVDLRTPKEKETSGLPDVPSSARDRVVEVEFAVTQDKKLRGQLRDPTNIEGQVTALQVASLKKVGKGSVLLLLDKNGGSATTVAKELSGKGFSKAYVITGGFDGRSGWVQSKLQIKPAAATLSSPPLFAAGTQLARKLLPAPR